MRTTTARTRARREDLGLDAKTFAQLAALTTPAQVQAFINAIPANFEPDGETVRTVQGVLAHRQAHCIEGAMVAACALWMRGDAPLLMHLDCALGDYPHVVTLFRRGRHWGAVSKSNHAVLRFRDPVYRSLRELAMSYFHEYVDGCGDKTLRSYSQPLDLSRIDPALWITNAGNCWEIVPLLDRLRHTRLLPAGQRRWLRRRDRFERKGNALVEYPEP